MQVINTDKAPDPGNYSQAILAMGMTLYTSGICGERPANHEKAGQLAGSSLEIQTAQCLANAKAIIKKAGGTIDKIVKVEADIVNMTEERLDAFELTYSNFLDQENIEKLPARMIRDTKLPWKDYQIMMAFTVEVP